MATIVEVGIRDVVVSVLRPDPDRPIQMLVTCTTHDATGEDVRSVAFPDWWELLDASDQALIAALYERFTAAARARLDIPDPAQPPTGP